MFCSLFIVTVVWFILIHTVKQFNTAPRGRIAVVVPPPPRRRRCEELPPVSDYRRPPERVSTNNTSVRYVSMSPGEMTGRRTGNQLFNFAALLHLAKMTGRRAVMLRHRNWWIQNIFDIDLPLIDSVELQLCPCVDIGESRGCAYEHSWSKTLPYRSDLANKSILLHGLTQSWLYTVGVEIEIRKQLRPHRNLSNEVCDFLQAIRPVRWRSTDYVTVGVHVRVGDMVSSGNFGFGFTMPKSPYYEQAIRYIVDHDLSGKDNRTQRPVNRRIQLIVACEQVYWCQSKINLSSVIERLMNESSAAGVDIDLVYSNGSSIGFDLVLLSRCDAMIMTTGTFGWWAAWLGNYKTVIYYKNWPRPYSQLDGTMNRAEFFPPHWIPIGGPYFTF